MTRSLLDKLRVEPVTRAALALALVYAAVMTAFSVASHLGLRTQLNDLGTAEQGLWALSNGDWLMLRSNTFDGALRSRLADQDFLNFLLVLPYRLWPRPELLLLLASLCCGLAGLGLYALARARLGARWLALVPAVAYWLSPLVHEANLFDFHVVVVEAAALAWALWAFESRRERVGFALVGLALLCNEDVGLIVLMLGIGYALEGSTFRRRGLLLAGLGLGWFLLMMAVVLPAVSEGSGFAGSDGAHRYRWLGQGFAGVLGGIVRDPGVVAAHLVRPDRLRVPIYWLLCGAAVALPAWRRLLPILPTAAMLLLSRDAWMTRLCGTYYHAVVMVFIVAGAILAAAPDGEQGTVRRWPLLYLAMATPILSLLLSPLPHGRFGHFAHFRSEPARHRVVEIAEQVPPEAKLCAQNNLGAHLARRSYITTRGGCRKADFRLFHLAYPGGPDYGLSVRTSARYLLGRKLRASNRLVRRTATDPRFELVAQDGRTWLFGRGTGGSESRGEVRELLDAQLGDLEREISAGRVSLGAWRRWLVGSWSW